MRPARGFTLIELLIAISILVVLSVIGLVVFSGVQAKARDGKRVNDLQQIQTALEEYYQDNGFYPSALSSLETKYLATIPLNPKRDDHSYDYNYVCSDECTKYTITAKSETISDFVGTQDSIVAIAVSGGSGSTPAPTSVPTTSTPAPTSILSRCAPYTDNGNGTCTATFYSSLDGYTERDAVVTFSWANIHNNAGTAAYDSVLSGAAVEIATYSNEWRRIVRAIFIFDTSGLPDAASISGATLSLYGTSKQNQMSNSPNINIYAPTPASNTALVANDYNLANWGTTAFSTNIAYANWSTVGYNDFVLNASGIAQITKISISKFGTRNANYDVANSPPGTFGGNMTDNLKAYFSEQGIGYKPKLVVTYTVP